MSRGTADDAPPPPYGRRTLRRGLVGLLIGAIALGGVLAEPAPAAEAMVQIGAASGYPGDSVQVQVQNTAAGAPGSLWLIAAPAGTTVTAASGASATGSGAFGCTLTGTGASCGPSSAGGWAAGNIVTMTLAIAP